MRKGVQRIHRGNLIRTFNAWSGMTRAAKHNRMMDEIDDLREELASQSAAAPGTESKPSEGGGGEGSEGAGEEAGIGQLMGTLSLLENKLEEKCYFDFGVSRAPFCVCLCPSRASRKYAVSPPSSLLPLAGFPCRQSKK